MVDGLGTISGAGTLTDFCCGGEGFSREVVNGVVFTSLGRYFVPSVLALSDFIGQKIYGSVLRKWV